jgi:hypothetical protein
MSSALQPWTIRQAATIGPKAICIPVADQQHSRGATLNPVKCPPASGSGGLYRHLQHRTRRQLAPGARDPNVHPLAVRQHRLHGFAGDADRHGPTPPTHAK